MIQTLEKNLKAILIVLSVLTAGGCQDQDTSANPNPQAITMGSESAASSAITDRWYSDTQVNQGRTVFQVNCADCHGDLAEGLADDWRQRLADGSYPPPPLNGTAHAWHHPLSVLRQTVDEGGIALGGKMPGFADTLTAPEKNAAIAYFQSFWTDEINRQWLQMGGTN